MIQLMKPQWIAKMYEGKVGRDHLGLGSVSSAQILPSLSPSINVLTFHPRYHSFYVFLLDEYWRRDLPRSRKSFIDFYRPREFVFSVAHPFCDHPKDHGKMQNVVGGLKTEPLAHQENSNYFTKTDYIDSELGGYGLYYRTVMMEMGIIYPGGQGFPYPVDVPTEYGREVAESFRTAIKNTRYYKEYFDQDECNVPIDVIREYIHFACLCQLQTSRAPDRSYLIDTFLHNGLKIAAESRRFTFRLILDIASQTNGMPLSEDLFRQLLYFKKTNTGITYQPGEALSEIYSRWRLYQAREYYAFALNSLWYYLCDWGVRLGGDIHPIPATDFYRHLEEEVNFSKLAGQLNLPQPNISLSSSFQGFAEWLFAANGTLKEKFDETCGIDSPINEHRLYNLAIADRNHPDVTFMVTGMITLLALIFFRFNNRQLWSRPEWEISKMGSDGRLSLEGYLRLLEKRLKSGPVTIEEILHWIYEDYVILQHQLVANNKLPDNTFRFRREGNKLHFFKLENALDFMNSRFNALNTTIHELGFCGNLLLENHPLTPDGEKLLREGDL